MKRIFLVIIGMLLTLSPLMTQAVEQLNLNLDVMFVVDCSGSMVRTDPDKMALTGANLFVDMSENTDTRAGYVMFTHRILHSRGLSPVEQTRDDFKRDISATEYEGAGDTDIALGLDTAFNLMLRGRENDKSRRPVIVLLSDGNTDLNDASRRYGTRSTNESIEHLQTVTSELEQAGIPVYTIGFNHNGTMNFEELSQVASTTGAEAQEAQAADQLPVVMRRVLEHLAGAKPQEPIFDGIATGENQDVTIPINAGVVKAAITIMPGDSTRDISLKDPYGNPPASDSFTENTDSLGNYKLLSLYSPEPGDWTLSFTGEKGGRVTIEMLKFDDINLYINPPSVNKNDVEVSWRVEYSSGQPIDDQILLDSLTVSVHAKDKADGQVFTETFPKGADSGTITIDKPGQYEAYLTLENSEIERESINSEHFEITSAPPISSQSGGTKSVSLWTFLGKKQETFKIDQVVNYKQRNLPLTVTPSQGEWQEYYNVDFNQSDSTVTVTAKKVCNTKTARIDVRGSDGSELEFYIDTTIRSGWILLAIALVALLALAAIAAIIAARIKPFLNEPLGSFEIGVSFSRNVSSAPPATTMRLPRVKAPRTLWDVFQYNQKRAGEEYISALGHISGFCKKIVFKAKSRKQLEVIVTKEGGMTVKSGISAGNGVYKLDKRSGLVVSIDHGGEETYEIRMGTTSGR